MPLLLRLIGYLLSLRKDERISHVSSPLLPSPLLSLHTGLKSLVKGTTEDFELGPILLILTSEWRGEERRGDGMGCDVMGYIEIGWHWMGCSVL